MVSWLARSRSYRKVVHAHETVCDLVGPDERKFAACLSEVSGVRGDQVEEVVLKLLSSATRFARAGCP